jgi:hypothetical protein
MFCIRGPWGSRWRCLTQRIFPPLSPRSISPICSKGDNQLQGVVINRLWNISPVEFCWRCYRSRGRIAPKMLRESCRPLLLFDACWRVIVRAGLRRDRKRVLSRFWRAVAAHPCLNINTLNTPGIIRDTNKIFLKDSLDSYQECFHHYYSLNSP